jgi:chorismate-pyruvate lyase
MLLRLLLKQDGSTTRLLEELTGCGIGVCVLEQAVVQELPLPLAGALRGKTFLRRLTALKAKGHVLLDSISYTDVDTLPRAVLDELVAGLRPIGHLFSALWTKRTFRHEDTTLLGELWATVGLPDPQASRSCVILTPKGPCMLLGETFRKGIVTLASEHAESSAC